MTQDQQPRTPSTPTPEPVESARAAGLRYVTDIDPGIRRQRSGKGFRYIGIKGEPIRDPAELKRIQSLAIPPAYTDVWICPHSNGHLQATGRDAKKRKQYRYHPRWRKVRDEAKYDRMMAFGKALPRIRASTDRDLGRPGLPREKVLATVVRLLEATLIRVGNEEYAKTNRSFGLTTLRNRHVAIEGSTLQFEFRGKSGKYHTISVKDRRLAKIVERCRDIPGYELFQYLDEDGGRQTIDSADVNAYLQESTGQDFTAKDFRTWAGTVLAALALQEFEAFDSQTQAKKNIVQAIETVAERLGNTPSICRKCYVHPAVIDSYLDGSMIQTLKQLAEQEMTESLHELPAEEAAVMALLRQRLARAEQTDKTDLRA
ncbi:MAG: DNA topoisomerase IB [Gemmatimonadaceae bacterium]|nr:DNA topoisomerase IB [Gloeobacterales cyanobacterium ES-bin-141]